MPRLFFLDTLQRRLCPSRRRTKLARAATWPTATAKINRWTIVPADDRRPRPGQHRNPPL